MALRVLACMISFFFFNDTATTEIYTLSLHDALPISRQDGSDRDDGIGWAHDDGRGRLDGLHHTGRGASRLRSLEAHGLHLHGVPSAHEVVLELHLSFLGSASRAAPGVISQGDPRPNRVVGHG